MAQFFLQMVMLMLNRDWHGREVHSRRTPWSSNLSFLAIWRPSPRVPCRGRPAAIRAVDLAPHPSGDVERLSFPEIVETTEVGKAGQKADASVDAWASKRNSGSEKSERAIAIFPTWPPGKDFADFVVK